jgi:hypothetical protein
MLQKKLSALALFFAVSNGYESEKEIIANRTRHDQLQPFRLFSEMLLSLAISDRIYVDNPRPVTSHRAGRVLAVDGIGDPDWNTLTVPALKDKLKSLGLKVSGKKQELVDRLIQHTSNVDESEPSAPTRGDVDHGEPISGASPVSTSPASDRPGWDTLTIPELKDRLKFLGLKVSGKKQELVERLKQHVESNFEVEEKKDVDESEPPVASKYVQIESAESPVPTPSPSEFEFPSNKPPRPASLRSFKLVADIFAETSEILHSAVSGVPVGDREKAILLGLLEYHPNLQKKLGGGVKDIVVDYAPQVTQSVFDDRRAICFWIVRDDGSKEDFSARKCAFLMAAVEGEDFQLRKPEGERKDQRNPRRRAKFRN